MTFAKTLLVVLLGCMTLFAPHLASAQSARRLPVVGVLGNQQTPTPAAIRTTQAFAEALRAAGWIEGQNVRFERRYSEGRPERFPDLAAELVRLNVDVIVTSSSAATKAAKDATSTIPIVFAAVGDPVGAGFVASLARPGGNVTGLSNQLNEMDEKLLQLAREISPRLRTYAVVWNPLEQSSALGFKVAQERWPALGVKPVSVPLRAPEDLAAAAEILTREKPDFVHVHSTPLAFRESKRIGEMLARLRLPSIVGTRTFVDNDVVMVSYGPDFVDLFRRAGGYVDKILRGARPAEIPVEQPTRFETIVNQRVARNIKFDVPAAFLLRADQIIE